MHYLLPLLLLTLSGCALGDPVEECTFTCEALSGTGECTQGNVPLDLACVEDCQAVTDFTWSRCVANNATDDACYGALMPCGMPE